MLSLESFKCDRKCGRCCKEYTVLLSEGDILRITGLGYNHSDFVQYESIGPESGKPLLKKDAKQWCVFLKMDKEGMYSCKIYNHRPDICRRYPFFGKPVDSCLPISLIPIRKDRG